MTEEKKTQPSLESGTIFRQKRIERGFSIEQVADAIYVLPSVIECIENNSYDEESLPSVTFVKGYIVAYARLLMISPETALEEYRLFLKMKEENKDINSTLKTESIRSTLKKKFVLKLMLFFTVLVAFIFISFFVISLIFNTITSSTTIDVSILDYPSSEVISSLESSSVEISKESTSSSKEILLEEKKKTTLLQKTRTNNLRNINPTNISEKTVVNDHKVEKKLLEEESRISPKNIPEKKIDLSDDRSDQKVNKNSLPKWEKQADSIFYHKKNPTHYYHVVFLNNAVFEVKDNRNYLNYLGKGMKGMNYVFFSNETLEFTFDPLRSAEVHYGDEL